jgi:hypothetical protein
LKEVGKDTLKNLLNCLRVYSNHLIKCINSNNICILNLSMVLLLLLSLGRLRLQVQRRSRRVSVSYDVIYYSCSSDCHDELSIPSIAVTVVAIQTSLVWL